MATKDILSIGLMEKIQAAAEAERKTPEELVTDALREYEDSRSWQHLVRYGQGRAAALGIRESDVDSLIKDHRRENPARER